MSAPDLPTRAEIALARHLLSSLRTGPWRTRFYDDRSPGYVEVVPDDPDEDGELVAETFTAGGGPGAERRVAEFIVLARSIMPKLLALADLDPKRDATGRWELLARKSPTGKSLFMCRSCARLTYTPDKECAGRPECAEWLPAGVYCSKTRGEGTGT